MTIPSSAAPSLIALDWGTTWLRAYLLGPEAQVMETRAEPLGVMQLRDGDFAAAFEQVTKSWRDNWRNLNTIASGMIGSTQGWAETPYCRCPAGINELAAALTPVHDGTVHIVSGIAQYGDAPNMMRGEEAQIVGALELHPALAADSVLVMPGTHSKWVHVVNGAVVNFTTYVTGELFAVLRDHSVLGRAERDAGSAPHRDSAEAAFARGVLAARSATLGITPLLFSARAMVLAQRVEPEASLEYLSGLLVGDEVRCGLATHARPSALIGDALLCARYVRALEHFDVPALPVYHGTAAQGLWEIARRAGLLVAPPPLRAYDT